MAESQFNWGNLLRQVNPVNCESSEAYQALDSKPSNLISLRFSGSKKLQALDLIILSPLSSLAFGRFQRFF